MGLFDFMSKGGPNPMGMALLSMGDQFSGNSGGGSLAKLLSMRNAAQGAQHPATDQPSMPSIMNLKPDASGNMPSLMALQQAQAMQPNMGLNLQGAGFNGTGFGGMPNAVMGAFPSSYPPRRF